MQKTLSELADLIHASVQGDESVVIKGLATLEEAGSQDLTFFHNPKYRPALEVTQAGAVILTEKMASLCPVNALIVEDPYFAYAQIAKHFVYQAKTRRGVHPTAIIGRDCTIADSASIGPYVVIEDNVHIDEKTVIGANSIIGEGAYIGRECEVAPRVTIHHHTLMGNQVVVFSGAVVGADGFGNAFHQGAWHKVPQLGRVVIEDKVEVGANTTIDRGAIGDTKIEQGVRLDNQIQIAHNVHIGAHTAIAACVGVAGSAKIGKYCMIGGGACIGGHIEIADQTMITGMAMVTNSIKEKGTYSSGTGFMENTQWRKNAIRFKQLDKTIRRLQASIARLEKEKEHD